MQAKETNTPGYTHPLGGIIGLLHSVGEIAICLPYHKKFAFLGHILVYTIFYGVLQEIL